MTVTWTPAPDTDSDTWRWQAACAGTPNLMFSENPNAIEAAKSICHGCPVREQCLDEAMRIEGGRTVNSRAGIYGGLTPHERMNLYRAQQRAKAKAA